MALNHYKISSLSSFVLSYPHGSPFATTIPSTRERSTKVEIMASVKPRLHVKCVLLLTLMLTVHSLIVIGHSQHTAFSRSARSLLPGETPDRPSSRYNSEDSFLLSRPVSSNCAAEVERLEGRERIPYQRLDSPQFYNSRYFMPFEGGRSKKAQKAILLDVGDYVIKGNGPPNLEAGIPARSQTNGVGGILRSSGK